MAQLQIVNSKNKLKVANKLTLVPKTAVRRNSIVWAIDPYDKNLTPDELSLQILESRHQGNLKKVYPAYVIDEFDKENLKDITEDVKEFLQKTVHQPTARPEILTIRDRLKMKPAQKLLLYAKLKKAEVIAVSTHGRSGFNKLLLGSFAEDLVKQSPTPVLFLTHNPESKESPRKVLFATDFSEKSKKAYLDFLKFAKNFAYEVVIYHVISTQAMDTSTEAAISMGATDFYTEQYFEEQKRWADRRSKEWIKLTKSKFPKISAKAIIQTNYSDVASSVVKCAVKENIGLVGLYSQASLLERTLFGSIAQEIFRSHRLPVWVAGPKFRSAK